MYILYDGWVRGSLRGHLTVIQVTCAIAALLEAGGEGHLVRVIAHWLF